ncbi:MAG: LOG family protein [Aggregatilineales bacterium]
MPQTIAVFGSAQLPPDDPVIECTYRVGYALAQAGYQVMTGGYGGVMEAASRGAHDAGGHVIGVTVPYIQLINERVVNPYVAEEIRKETYHDRLFYLAQKPNGYVVMPGGVGTAQELIEVWQLLRLKTIPLRPLVCYGEFWRPVVNTLIESPYVPPTEVPLVHFADTPEDVVAFLTRWSHED